MKIRIIAAALAAFFMLPFLGSAAYAAEVDEPGLDDPAVAALTEQAPEDDATDTPTIPATEGPAETETAPRPFTPAGTGTVIDLATDADGKVFYTIMTPDENVFYLVIDRQRGQENVYFLNAVTEADLLALAVMPPAPDPAPTTPQTSPTPAEPEPTPPPAPEKSGGNMGMIILVVAVVLVGGGAGWYLKIYKPKQQQADSEEDYSADEGDPYGEDEPGAESDDDSPPWYDDDEPGAESDDDSPPWYDDDEPGGDDEA